MGLGRAEISFTTLEPQKIPAITWPRIAVLGRSNVGKSSLLNAIMHPQKLFRTGSTPGLTRGVLGATIAWGRPEKIKLELIDLPGYGFSKRPQDHDLWQNLAEALAEQSQERIFWYWLIDPKRRPDDLDLLTSSWLKNKAYSIVFTKSDRIKPKERSEIMANWARCSARASEKPMWASAQNSEGIDILQKRIRDFAKLQESLYTFEE